jgi:integrase
MPRKAQFPPPLRTHKTGQAYCRWQKRNYYFGKAGTAEAAQAYEQFKARLAANRPASSPPTAAALTVTDAVTRFLAHVQERLPESGGARVSYGYCLRPLLRLHGATPAAEFGPDQLEQVRDAMTGGTWQTPAEAERLRRSGHAQKWAASRTNKALGVVRTCWRWLERRGLVPRGSHASLSTAEGVGPRTPGVRRTARRKATSREDLDAVLPLIQRTRRHRPVAAMLELQWLAGMRSCEVRLMRCEDIDRAGGPVIDGVRIWVYRVGDEANKNGWRGQDRNVLLGPRCQAVLAPWLARATGYVFPVAAGGARPYTRRAYAGCVRAAAVKAGVECVPYGGRHEAKNRVTRELGLDAARAFLGQQSLGTTNNYGDALDLQTAARAAARLA